MAGNALKDKSLMFAVRCVNLYKLLCDERKEFVLSKQMLRSGTSIGANISEALCAESNKDFIHKLHIAYKETDAMKAGDQLVVTGQARLVDGDKLEIVE